MITEPLPVGNRRFTVPRNRWDLVDGWDAVPAEVSVVIPYFREQRLLDLILAALTVQTLPRTRMQVVIADDGSPEPPTIPSFAACLAPVVVRQDDHGFRPGQARNLGVQAADGAVLAFLDGDTIPEPDYLQQLSRLPALLPDAVVGGRRRHAALRGWTAQRLLEWLAGAGDAPEGMADPAWLADEYQRTGNLLRTGSRSFSFLIGAVLGCSKSLHTEIGGFDESIVGYGGEDYDYTYRAANAGAVLAYVPQAVAWHEGPEWSGRIDSEPEKRALKNREMSMLSHRIPVPSFRGSGQLHPFCDVVVQIEVTGWSLGAAVVCIQSLLTVLDCRIWLTGDAPQVARVVEAVGTDPRIGTGDVPAPFTARARARLVITRPLVAGGEFRQRLEQMLERDEGRLVVADGGQLLGVVTSTRAMMRSARWGHSMDVDPVDALFGVVNCAAADVGLTAITGEPSLSAVFGGWA